MINPAQFKNVIFDMDGVLIESETLQVEAEKFVCAKFGIPVPEREWMTFKGKTNRSIFAYIVNTYAQTPVSVEDLIEAKRAYVKTHVSNVKMIPGALAFLAQMRDFRPRKQIALTTSTGHEIQRMIFERLHLDTYFDHIITGDDVTLGKPHPEPYLLTVHQLDARAEECVVIEDSDNGIQSAKRAGCAVIGITTSFPEERLLEVGADRVILSYAEIMQLPI